MIENLKQIEDKMLLDLLVQQDKWNTVFINYHPPVVERCWIQLGNYRLNLHFIHKCEAKDALYHPHTWPSAIHVLSGKYEMGLAMKHICGHKDMEMVHNGGTIKDIGLSPSGHYRHVREIAKLEMNGDNYYEMLDPKGWHYVRPIGDVCATVMLTGKPWEVEEGAIEKPENLGPLPPQKKLVMLKWFEEYYRNRVHVQKIIENEQIKKTDWVKLDENAMSLSDKRGLDKYFNVLGFVIGRDKNFIDVRFGNDRTKIHSKNLILMNSSDKPKNIEDDKKKLDHTSKELWPDDDKDEI